MSQVNWEEHRAQFAAMKAENGTTIKEYSELHGLSFNTARKQLNSKKSAAPAAMAKGKQTGDLSAGKGKKIPSSGSKNAPKTSVKPAEFTKTDVKGRRAAFRAPPKGGTGALSDNGIKNSDLVDSGKGSFEGDHDKKIPKSDTQKPGRKKAKATKAQMIPYIGRDAVVLPGNDAARRMLEEGEDSHLQQVIEMAQESALEYRAVVQDEATRLREEIEGIKPGVEVEGVHPSIKLRGLLEDAAYFMNDFTTRLASIYQGEKKLRQGAEKLKQAERQQAFKEAEAREKIELARLQAEQRAKEIDYRIGADARAGRIIATAIRMREREELDDIGVAEYIERQGVQVPATLSALARKAIEAIEPPVSETVVDDAQIEREAEEYARQQREHPQWLDNRRAEVAKIVEDLGCGDVDATGERKAGEFEADDDGIELDPSATSDIYGDYDAPDEGYDDDAEIPISPPEDE
ncbi:DNA pacase A subunit (plasmid) [Raoultella ornithinolytica]|uniref:DNA pacase A subunit n=1 Tax=Raoultella ornithinolytica TaxID=54291 RepID=UPI003F65DA9F